MTSGQPDEHVSRRGFLTAVAGGSAIAASTAGASAQETTAGNETTTSGGGAAGPTEEVVVGPAGELVYEPEELEITPGTTVRWVWESDNHNIVVGEQPEGANWQGTPGGQNTTYDTGYTYTHTFQTLGTYNYWCQPHKAAGMIADVVVSEGGGGDGGPRLPNSAMTIGVALTAAMVSTLSFAYFFLKYGGDYEAPE